MKIRVLGPLEVGGTNGPVTLGGLRQRAVLAVLAIRAGRVVSVDALADQVWNGEPPPRASGSLQVYVSKLRRVLEPGREGRTAPWEVLVTRAPGYVLQVRPDDLDATGFERAGQVAAGHLREGAPDDAILSVEEAMSWWRGEPYAEFAYADFARDETARLIELRWQLAEIKGDALLAAGRAGPAVAELESLVREAPLRERLRGQLMLALYRTGRQADALACYQEGRGRLVDELGLEPGPDLQELERRILDHDEGLTVAGLAGPVDPAGAGQGGGRRTPIPGDGQGLGRRATDAVLSGGPLVGRQPELDRLDGVVDHTVAGHGRVVVVSGEAGIGKSRLADEVAARAEAAGCSVLVGRCPELDGVPPFWPWVQILRALLAREDLGLVADDRLAALVPELGGPTGGANAAAVSDGAAFQLYDALTQLLLAVAAHDPLLVIIEDLHWADPASLRLLRFLAPAMTRAAIGVVVTVRDEEASDDLVDLLAATARLPHAERLELARLAPADVGALATALAPDDVTGSMIGILAARSAGNPFLLGELVRLGAGAADEVPTGVGQIIQRRVGQLRPETTDLLLLASCCPDSFAIDVLAPILGRSMADAVDLVDEALAARLVDEVPDRPGLYRFSHPLTRDAVSRLVSDLRRAHLHRQIGEFLELAVDPDDETVARLAHHLSAAAATGTGPVAARWLLEAGRRDLARWAADGARALFGRGLDLADTYGGVDDEVVTDLLIGLGSALRFSGDQGFRPFLDQARDRAARLGDAGRIVDAALAAGIDAWALGSLFGAVDEATTSGLARALPELDAQDGARRVMGTALLATEQVFADDPEVARRLAADALVAARQLGAPQPLAHALMARWVAVWGPESVAERAALVDELEEVTVTAGLEPGRPLLLRWANALEQADPIAMADVLAQVDRQAERGRHPALETLAAWRRSLFAILDGRFDEAEALISTATDRAAVLSTNDSVTAGAGQLALLYWQAGRLPDLIPILEVMQSEQPGLTAAVLPLGALALVQDGRTEEARAMVASLRWAGAGDVPAPMMRSGTISCIAEVAVALDDRDLARATLARLGSSRLSPVLIDQVGVFYLGARAGYQGALHLVLGELDEAVAALDEAVAVNGRVGAVVFVLRNQLHLADALLRRDGDGDVARAEASLAEAMAVADRLGLEADLQRARALLPPG